MPPSSVAADVPVVLAGDYNVVPTDARHLSDQILRRKRAARSRESRARFRRLLDAGLGRCACARCIPTRRMYTFWDYKRNRWPRDAGLRIDHLLLSRQAATRLVAAGVDREVARARKAPATMRRSGWSCAMPRRKSRARGRLARLPLPVRERVPKRVPKRSAGG